MNRPRTAVLVADATGEGSLRHFADVAVVRDGRGPQSLALGVPGFDGAVERLGTLVDGLTLFMHGDAAVLDAITEGLRRNGTNWARLTAEDVLLAAGGSPDDDMDAFLGAPDTAGRAREIASLIDVDLPVHRPDHPTAQPVTPEGIEEYLSLLREVFEDGILDGGESEVLTRTAREHGLSGDDADALHDIFLRRVAVDAWVDGRITEPERAHLRSVARQLGVEDVTVVTLLLSDDPPTVALHRGDRVAFHGATAHPRQEWDRRIDSAGLVRTDISGDVVCLVTAHGEIVGTAATTARELGVPVIDEVMFSRLLAGVEPTPRAVTPEDLPSADAVTGGAPVPLTDVFPWLVDVEGTHHDAGHIAATWITYFGTAPLHTMSPALDPVQRPDGVPTGSGAMKRWLSAHTPLLGATADDLLELRGVGSVRRQVLVEAVVQEALDSPTVVAAELDPAGTPLTVDETQDVLPDRPSPSVRNAPPLTDELTSDTIPEETRGMHLRDGVWNLLMTVNRDNLRGSGMAVPLALTGMYGLAHGDSVDLPGRLGPQTVSWTTANAQVSTFRRYLEDLGSVEGDRVWLRFGRDFDVTPAPALLDGLDGVAEALNMMGIEPDGITDPIAAINVSLGLDPAAARRKTVARLDHRDEVALAELVRGLR